MLYFRMLLTMGVSLFTVRIVLETLGVVDYGIYNVVGGIVTMFAFLSNTMASASQRYFAFELGKKDFKQLQNTFSLTMLIYFFIAIIILILAQTVGLWFLNHKMMIPNERLNAANWVYQFAILSFMMNMFTIPYNALIIARERMNVYAWVSIVEVLLKLLIVYLLIVISGDKLKTYAILLFGVTTLVTLIYRTYCIRKFQESKFIIFWDKKLFKEMVSYSGWNLFGAIAGILNGQGLNIILNLFWGPVVNAARGIAFQISSTVNNFVLNFMTASRPQIIKYYAEGEKTLMYKLIQQSSKLSFYLLWIISIPLIFETDTILRFWLTDIPEYTTIFTKLMIITALIDSISYSLQTAAQATGRIKIYQAVVGGIMMTNLPISYIILRMGYTPDIVLYVSIGNSIICLILRLQLLKKLIGFSPKIFVLRVLKPIIITTSIISLIITYTTQIMEKSTNRILFTTGLALLMSTTIIFAFGLTRNEKQFLKKIIRI